jgi:hypothetical protein
MTAVEPEAETAPQESPAHNERPALVSDLFFQAEAYPNWAIENWDKRRFFVLNLAHVMRLLQAKHTTLKNAFEAAATIIKDKTKWSEQYKETFSCSPVQIYPKSISEPKHLNKTATIIVAMEAFAAEKDDPTNVYDFLRIIAAFYFVDRLDTARLDALRQEYDGWTEDQKNAAFGTDNDPEPAHRSFDDQCLNALEQVEGSKLLEEMSAGFTVTKYVADELVKFVNRHFPARLHIGPALPAGSERRSISLGTKEAAPSLRVPQYRDPSALVPPYLKGPKSED